MKKFIVTTDNEVAQKLKNMGLQMLSNNMKEYVFLNNERVKLSFDNLDSSKIHYSNILHI